MNKCPYCKGMNFRNRLNSKSNIYECKKCNQRYTSEFNFMKYLIYMILISTGAFIFINSNAYIPKDHESWTIYIYYIIMAALAGLLSEDYVQLDKD
ncbi:hypothetical protein CXF83_15030 [Shewanella sp. Choline-02u-19]|nr:hypothetical protein CXF83_15030 [Shewanella sp. Choline-02u-19]